MQFQTSWNDTTRVRSIRRKTQRILDQLVRLQETIEWHAEDMDGTTDVDAVSAVRNAHAAVVQAKEKLQGVV